MSCWEGRRSEPIDSAEDVGEQVTRGCADINAAAAEETAKNLDGALAITMDVRDQDSCEAAVEATITRFDRLDGLVTAAGVQVREKMRDKCGRCPRARRKARAPDPGNRRHPPIAPPWESRAPCPARRPRDRPRCSFRIENVVPSRAYRRAPISIGDSPGGSIRDQMYSASPSDETRNSLAMSPQSSSRADRIRTFSFIAPSRRSRRSRVRRLPGRERAARPMRTAPIRYPDDGPRLHLLGHLGEGHLVVPHRVSEARNCGPAATPHPRQFPSQTAPKRRQKPSIDPLHSC